MIILSYIIIFLLFWVMFLCFLFFVSPLFSLIPFVPVPRKIFNEIISALELKNESVLYDLGCGDGRILFACAKVNPHISYVGIEISPFPFLLAKIKKLFYFSKNVRIIYGSFYKINISSASHVFLYLFPGAMDKLLPKFEKELKAGSRVVSCDFGFSKREANKILEIKSTKSREDKKLYVYDF